MNQPQPGKPESTALPTEAATARMRELERTLAYEFCCSVIDADLTKTGDIRGWEDDVMNDEWFDEASDARGDDLIPECVEYLMLRGLIERHSHDPDFFRIRDESEGVA